jgi:hypothetical protein
VTGVADRHSGTLDGRLTEVGEREARVAVVLEPTSIDGIGVQHTAWMLVNLLARLENVVGEVLVAGADATLLARVQPGGLAGGSFKGALVDGANQIGAVAARAATDPAEADIILTVGQGGRPDVAPLGGWRVHGEGFCGALAKGEIAAAAGSKLPFGPYVAACLASGEVFRATRIPAECYKPARGISYSLWDHTIGAGAIHEPGSEFGPLTLDFGMAGVGAVGTALAQCIWACPQLYGQAVIADADEDGIDTTNLNRCVIFNADHIGRPKASTAAELLADCDVDWHPIDGVYERDRLPHVPGLLVSAVDRNQSRHALQHAFWPGRLIAASTKALRAELLRCGPPGTGPCLCCYNPLEVDVPDSVRRAQLRAMTEPGLVALAAEVGHSVEDLRRWANDGECGQAGDAALAHLREQDVASPAMFSVGFVSLLAGTMLAAQLVKEHGDHAIPLDDHTQSAKLQFINPAASRNGIATAVRRDPRCTACSPGSPAAAIWRDRATSWRPPEQRDGAIAAPRRTR